jgi:hypothetical protein
VCKRNRQKGGGILCGGGITAEKEDCKIFIKNTQEEGGIEKLNSKKRDRGDQWHLILVFFGGLRHFLPFVA